MPLWQRLLITLVTMLLTSLVAGLLWRWLSCLTRVQLNDHFLSTGRLSGIHLMLRQTSVKPEMSRARAATCDTSIIRPSIKGPRSVIRTTAERPVV